MKKIILIISVILFSLPLFSEEFKGFMGIDFGSSVEQAEIILAEKNWHSTSQNYSNVGLVKKYKGGTYGNISGLELEMYYLIEDDKEYLYKVNLKYADYYKDFKKFTIEKYSQFADVLEALLTKYDWIETQGSENIRTLSKEFGYKPNQTISYIAKDNSSIFFDRREYRDNYYGKYIRNLFEDLTFTCAPLNEIYENNLKIENARQEEIKQKELQEKENERLKQLDSLKSDL